MKKLWQWVRDSRRRGEQSKDEIAVEKRMLEHEQEEREKFDPRTPIPPMRNNTDWAGWA